MEPVFAATVSDCHDPDASSPYTIPAGVSYARWRWPDPSIVGLAFQLGCGSVAASSTTGQMSGLVGGSQPAVGEGRPNIWGIVTNE